MSKLYAVIRVRGTVGIRKEIRYTLESLMLTKPNHCIIVPENECMVGMLNKAKDYITWGEISDDMLTILVSKRGRISSKVFADTKEATAAVKNIKAGKIRDSGIRPVFRLSPPVKGHERGGIKRTFVQKGALGYRGEKINDLLTKMI
ncbi:MAG: 50S ribosomal protein L30 [Nanohaloarchaea archaeon]|nr:50S ribosomal protein L30 [Candidatus Nanohaloarchaea archaeon]